MFGRITGAENISAERVDDATVYLAKGGSKALMIAGKILAVCWEPQVDDGHWLPSQLFVLDGALRDHEMREAIDLFFEAKAQSRVSVRDSRSGVPEFHKHRRCTGNELIELWLFTDPRP